MANETLVNILKEFPEMINDWDFINKLVCELEVNQYNYMSFRKTRRDLTRRSKNIEQEFLDIYAEPLKKVSKKGKEYIPFGTHVVDSDDNNTLFLESRVFQDFNWSKILQEIPSISENRRYWNPKTENRLYCVRNTEVPIFMEEKYKNSGHARELFFNTD